MYLVDLPSDRHDFLIRYYVKIKNPTSNGRVLHKTNTMNNTKILKY